jgi:hypothetical protein
MSGIEELKTALEYIDIEYQNLKDLIDNDNDKYDWKKVAEVVKNHKYFSFIVMKYNSDIKKINIWFREFWFGDYSQYKNKREHIKHEGSVDKIKLIDC